MTVIRRNVVRKAGKVDVVVALVEVVAESVLLLAGLALVPVLVLQVLQGVV